jgi:lysozyme family protein
MTSPLFDRIIDCVISKEGYWTNDASDPGGLTIWGICYRDWPDKVLAMKPMSKEDALAYAKQFYYENYWLPLNAEQLDDTTARLALDGAVNQGVRQMADWIKGLGELITFDKILAWRMCKYVETIENNPKLAQYAFPWMQRMAEVYQWHG